MSAPPLTFPVSSHFPDLANPGADTVVAYAFFTIPPTLLGFSYDSARQSNGWFYYIQVEFVRPFRTHPLPAGRLRSPTTADSRLVLLLSIIIYSIHHLLYHASYPPLRLRRSDYNSRLHSHVLRQYSREKSIRLEINTKCYGPDYDEAVYERK